MEIPKFLGLKISPITTGMETETSHTSDYSFVSVSGECHRPLQLMIETSDNQTVKWDRFFPQFFGLQKYILNKSFKACVTTPALRCVKFHQAVQRRNNKTTWNITAKGTAQRRSHRNPAESEKKRVGDGESGFLVTWILLMFQGWWWGICSGHFLWWVMVGVIYNVNPGLLNPHCDY